MNLRLLNIVLFSFIAHLSYGQVTLSIDQTEMLIGDQRTLTLEMKLPADAEWMNSNLELSDTITQIQTIQSIAAKIQKTANQLLIQKQWIIAPFDTGLIYLPGIPVAYKTNGQVETRMSNDIPIVVRGVEADSSGLAPIKNIFKEGRHWIDYLGWMISIVFVLLIGLAIYLWKNRKIPEEEIIVIERLAHEVALEELDHLEREQLWQKGEIKAYHSKLTHIFREYLEKRFNIKALESTTMEIKGQLSDVGLEEDKKLKSIELLQLSDLVKFAKATPRVEVHAELMNYVRDFIFNTKAKIQPIVSLNDEEE